MPWFAICKLETQEKPESESESPRTRGVNGWAPSGLRGERRRCTSPLRQAGIKQSLPSSASLLYSGPQWIRRCPSMLGKHLPYSPHPLKCKSHLDTPSRTHPEIIFNQIYGQPMTQLVWYVKLTITVVDSWVLSKANQRRKCNISVCGIYSKKADAKIPLDERLQAL